MKSSCFIQVEKNNNNATIPKQTLIINFNFVLFLLGELMFLNEATLLDNIKNRYYKDKIYVSNQHSHFIPSSFDEGRFLSEILTLFLENIM